MKKSKLFCTLFGLFFLFCSFTTKAQNKFHVIFDYHYLFGLVENGDMYKINRSTSKMYGNSFHFTAMYSFTKAIDAGIGIGADRCENPPYNTFPVYASFKYFPFSQNHSPYVFTNLGYAISSATSNPGAMWDLGIGYQKMFRKHFGLNFQFGYSLKQIKGDVWFNDYIIGKVSQRRNSLSFGIGIII